MIKYECGGKKDDGVAAFKPKVYNYLIDDGEGNKKAKGEKKCIIKHKLKVRDCETCLEVTRLKMK